MKIEKTIESKTSYLMVFSLLLFSGMFYLYYPHIQNYSTTPKWLFLSISSLFILYFGRKEKFSWSLGMSIWFLFVAFYLIGCLNSYNLWDSIVRAIPLLLSPLVVLILRREENDNASFYSKIATVLILLFSPFLLLTIGEIVGLIVTDSYTHLSTYQFRYTFGNRNQFAELIALLVPLLATALLYNTVRWKKYFFLIGIALLYITGTLLLNRAALLVLYGVYPIAILVFLLQKIPIQSRKYSYFALFGSILLSSAIIVSPLRKKIPVVKDLLETEYGSGSERLQLWSNSMDLWKEKPIFGQGSGDWKIEILRTSLQQTQANESKVFYQQAHNDFIQITVENGIIGLLLFVTFFGISLYLLFKSSIDFKAKIFLSAGVVAYMLISNFSFPIEKVELLILLFLFLLPGLKQPANPIKLKTLTLGTFIILFTITLLSLNWLKNERNYFLFKQNIDLNSFAAIDKTYYTIDPTSAPLYWHDGNKFYNKGEYEKAIEAYNLARKYNPNHVHVINNIGSCYYALGNKKKAEEFYKKALAINPAFIETLMNYSSFNFNTGNINGALDQILSIPPNKEPENYKMYMVAISKAKYNSMIELYDDPEFENFLLQTYDNDNFQYEISKKARISGRSYEMELRAHLKGFTKK